MAIDESSIPVPDTAPPDFPRLHDIGYFGERLTKAFARVSAIRPYRIESLGQVDGQDLILISPEELKEGRANILTAGGFHGEEPAGPWGIVTYLETATAEELNAVNHSFLPLANPTGFARATRYNAFGENPSANFIAMPRHEREDTEATNKGTLSAEGEILVTHRPRLIEFARDGFVTLHEDWRVSDAFLYVNERAPMPSPFAATLRGALSRHFNMAADNDPILGFTKDGLCSNELDDTFESWVYFWGVPRVSTTETPGQQPALRRIACNRDIVASFASFMGRHYP